LPCATSVDQNRLTAAAHPSWCIVESPSDNGTVHYSDVAEVVPTAGGAFERRPIQIHIEQLHHETGAMDPAQIVLNHADVWVDPMTADEALHLAGLLILAARRAMSR
jgi:hypothetical protein